MRLDAYFFHCHSQMHKQFMSWGLSALGELVSGNGEHQPSFLILLHSCPNHSSPIIRGKSHEGNGKWCKGFGAGQHGVFRRRCLRSMAGLPSDCAAWLYARVCSAVWIRCHRCGVGVHQQDRRIRTWCNRLPIAEESGSSRYEAPTSPR